jgi:hypothetical protein
MPTLPYIFVPDTVGFNIVRATPLQDGANTSPLLTSTSGFANSSSRAGNTCTAHALNSGINACGSSASFVNRFAAVAPLRHANGMNTLISTSQNNIFRVGKIAFPRREHLHRTRLVLRDQRLRVERVVREQIRGGFGEVPGDEHHTHRRLPFDKLRTSLGHGGAWYLFTG